MECLPFQAKYMFQNMVIMPLVVKEINLVLSI